MPNAEPNIRGEGGYYELPPMGSPRSARVDRDFTDITLRSQLLQSYTRVTGQAKVRAGGFLRTYHLVGAREAFSEPAPPIPE